MANDLRAPPTDIPLPAVLRLPPHHAILPFGPDGRLLGLDPETALAVDRLPPGLAAMLDELTEPVPVTGLLARAEERGAATEQAVPLLAELVRAGALEDAAVVERRVLQRAESRIVVSGDGPLAVGVVLGLVQAGVGAVHPDTAGYVRAADLGTGFLDADQGRERGAAIRDAVRRIRPEADVVATSRRLAVDLVVLADTLIPEPAVVARLHAAGTAHLPVRLRDGIGVVGPLVLPGRTACLRCLELERSARDPVWPAVAAQLTGRRGQAAPAATAATAALATAQVLAALEAMSSGGTQPPTLETTIELDASAGAIIRRRWLPRAECPCGATKVHGAVSARSSGGSTGRDRRGQGPRCATRAEVRRRERIMV